MKRTQLNLDERAYYQLVSYAESHKTSISGAARRIINENSWKPKSKAKNPLLGLAELGKKNAGKWKGPHDLSTRVDYYLYGPGSPKWGYLYKKK